MIPNFLTKIGPKMSLGGSDYLALAAIVIPFFFDFQAASSNQSCHLVNCDEGREGLSGTFTVLQRYPIEPFNSGTVRCAEVNSKRHESPPNYLKK